MEPKDLLKKLHPNQFSDSKEIDKIECPRELLDFYLTKLSEQNKHFDFEDFIKNLLEREIWPNLIEETGPAGGGDGKVDIENYPISKDIQNYWWYGLNEKNTGAFDINYLFDGIDTYTITLDSLEMYDISVENHNLITDILFKFLSNILAVNFIYEDYEKALKEILEDDKSFERSLNHTSSLYNLNKIFGKEEDIDIPNYSISRDREWYANIKKDNMKEETIDPFKEKEDIIYGVPENNPFENISHKNIYSSGMIKINHWDTAKWKGVAYLGDAINKEFIKIGFLFENEEGAKKVFKDLIDNATKEDKEGNIVVSFIKGISKTNIYDYRVMITGKVKIPKDNSENIIINSATRFHQMNCNDDKNIKILENIINSGKDYKISILPMIVNNDKEIKPLWEYEITLKYVTVKHAYEIGKDDLESAVILEDDNPIIPSHIKDAPINEVLKLKKSI